MNQYFGPSHEEWQQQWNNTYSREADQMVDDAFEDYEEHIKRARAFAFIRTTDPLERPSPTLREFHLRWSNKIIQLAGDALLTQLAHAQAHREGR